MCLFLKGGKGTHLIKNDEKMYIKLCLVSKLHVILDISLSEIKRVVKVNC